MVEFGGLSSGDTIRNSPSFLQSYVWCPFLPCPLLPERVFCVKEGLQRFSRFFRGGFSVKVCTFHAVRTGGLSIGYAMHQFTSRCSRLFSFETLAFQITFGRCGFAYEVSSVVLFLVRPCLNTSLRGVPRTCVGVRARAQFAPTPIKSIRPPHGHPGRSTSHSLKLS